MLHRGRSFIVFLRHGHRSPARALSPSGADISVENNIWKKLLFNDDETLNKRFPIVSHANNKEPDDSSHFPYGCLSSKGANYVREIGAKYQEFFKVKINENSRVCIFSSNYRRTQLSGQCFLDGLLKENSLQIPVVVRDFNICSLIFYDKTFAARLVKKVQSSPDFIRLENMDGISEIKDLLARFIPALITKNGFNWPLAFDYFTTRSAHNLPMIPEIEQLSQTVKSHFISRYTLYNRDAEHLALSTLPLLQDILYQVSNSLKRKEDPASHDTDHISIFSGHDITIIPLLHVLGAEVVVNKDLDRVATDRSELAWPYFGSTVTLEVIPPDNSSDDSGIHNGYDSNMENTRVKIFWDFRPIKINLQHFNEVIAGRDSTEKRSIAESDSFSIRELNSLIITLETYLSVIKPYVRTEATQNNGVVDST